MLYDHVIVPFDGTTPSRDVAMYAADLARVLGARLQILTSAEVRSTEGLERLKDRAVNMSEQTVDVWIDAQQKPSEAVAASIEHRPRSLVCMATHARGGLRKVLGGSVAEDVLRAIDAPVLLFGPAWQPQEHFAPTRLLVCIDGSRTSEEILPEVNDWMAQLGVSCTLVHVDTGDDHGLSHDAQVADRIARLVAPFVDAGAELSVVNADDVPDAIVALGETHPEGILAMATHGRSGIDRLTTGSITMEVLADVRIPVLVRSATHL